MWCTDSLSMPPARHILSHVPARLHHAGGALRGRQAGADCGRRLQRNLSLQVGERTQSMAGRDRHACLAVRQRSGCSTLAGPLLCSYSVTLLLPPATGSSSVWQLSPRPRPRCCCSWGQRRPCRWCASCTTAATAGSSWHQWWMMTASPEGRSVPSNGRGWAGQYRASSFKSFTVSSVVQEP